ncbi:MAG: glycosyltransferase [Cytophagales bacterium]|nr:glycosyltransferase [Cytophagales bacterium]
MKTPERDYDLSVIIPTYNRCTLLDYTLDSLLKQNIDKQRFEVVIGDDGSTDDTRAVVRKYEGLMNVKYVFQEDEGYRPASARNKAIRASEGRICLFVDSSVMLDPDCIASHIDFHDSSSAAKVALGYVYGFDHNEESEDLLKKLVVPSDARLSVERLSEHPVFHDVREAHYVKYKDELETLPAPWFYFWTCHLSVTAKELFLAGLFDEKYDGRWGVEDNDLGYRLHQNGVQICLLREAVSIHYPHGKDKVSRHHEGYENCRYFNNKFPGIETQLFLDHYTSKELVDINELVLAGVGKQEKVV